MPGSVINQLAVPLLNVQDLIVHFRTRRGVARAVDGVSFRMEPGKTHALVGESGCGKSVTALAIAGLLPPGVEIKASALQFKDTNLLSLSRTDYRALRGSNIAMIFQEPMTALNPVMKVGHQIQESLELHPSATVPGNATSLRKRVIEIMASIGLRETEQLFDKYPHQLSGGMRQRIMIAMALACNPALLIADEPTTALDVTVQKQILDLMNQLQQDLGTAILLITHDLGVVASSAHTMSVLYAGQVVESGSVKDVFNDPCHPYTRALFDSLPVRAAGGPLKPIPGSVPSASEYDQLSSSCRFFDRCQFKDDRCFKKGSSADHVSVCARERETVKAAG